MSPQEVFAAARAYDLIKPGLIIKYVDLARMVEEQEDARMAIEAEFEAAQERREQAAWSNIYERNDQQREEDERELAIEAWLGLR